MHLFLTFFIALLLAVIACNLWRTGRLLPSRVGSWGTSNDDPRVAVAAMLYAVAREDGPIHAEKEQRILSMLSATFGLGGAAAQDCVAAGRRLSNRVSGDLNSRLHQLKGPIERKCSAKEKQDVVDMLHQIAGKSAVSTPSVREGLGRLSATLLHG